MSSAGILARLREETLPEHQALENSLNLMDHHLTPADYLRTLQRFHAFVARWEANAAQSCPERLRPFFEQRRRAYLAGEDLRFFGAEPLTEIPELPGTASPAVFWGEMYVMEGSTLGGQLISRHLETVLGLRNGIGYSYFRGHGAETGAVWKVFCRTLNHEAADLDCAQIIASARQIFDSFRAWLIQQD